MGKALRVGMLAGLLLGGCATSDREPPAIVLPSRSESTTPVYDSLSPPDRAEVDATIGRCRDGRLGCTEDYASLETAAPIPMALAERACSEGRPDLCARLALLHLRGAGPGTTRAEGLRLLNVACQARIPTACTNLAIALRADADPARRGDVQQLLRFACAEGHAVACALDEEPTVTQAIGEAPPPAPVAAGDAKTPSSDGPDAPPPPPPLPKPSNTSLDSLVIPGRILILGATFGTREAPDQTSRVVHAAAARGVPTILALDIVSAERPRLDRFLRGPGDADALTELLKGFWQRPYQDGRSSKAVLRMIVQARQDVASALPLALVPIDEPLEGEAHTRTFVGHLQRIARERPDRAIVALLGNAQAFQVARALRKAGFTVTAVLMGHDGGDTWSCLLSATSTPGDATEVLRKLQCGVAPVAHITRVRSSDAIGATVYRARFDGRFRLYPVDRAREVFDYVFPIGAVSASGPAFKPR